MISSLFFFLVFLLKIKSFKVLWLMSILYPVTYLICLYSGEKVWYPTMKENICFFIIFAFNLEVSFLFFIPSFFMRISNFFYEFLIIIKKIRVMSEIDFEKYYFIVGLPKYRFLFKFHFFDLTKISNRVIIYNILKGFYGLKSGKIDIYTFILERLFIFLSGIDPRRLRRIFDFSNDIYKKVFVEKSFALVREGIPITINNFIVKNYVGLLQKNNNQRIYFEKGVIKFNPQSPKKKKEESMLVAKKIYNYWDTNYNPMISSVKIRGSKHVMLGNTSTSPIATSKNKELIKSLPLDSEYNRVVYNSYTNPDLIKDDIVDLTRIINNVYLEPKQASDSIFFTIEMRREFLKETGIWRQGYEESDTYYSGDTFNEIIRSNNTLFNNGLTYGQKKKIEFLYKTYSELTKEEKELLANFSKNILDKKCWETTKEFGITFNNGGFDMLDIYEDVHNIIDNILNNKPVNIKILHVRGENFQPDMFSHVWEEKDF